ncbi:hypothetical protein AXF42_Ash010878 [Apostasia shenzhenica]|uniref:Uncharacterized protein n=1 Tax=Apostasia shenzhenica TaxID=1088818 RepID=A0A2I0A0X0_9ASPA|nr:hypothetical protein AXF42_Ash010878 [Apostasia shenzhenica]
MVPAGDGYNSGEGVDQIRPNWCIWQPRSLRWPHAAARHRPPAATRRAAAFSSPAVSPAARRAASEAAGPLEAAAHLVGLARPPAVSCGRPRPPSCAAAGVVLPREAARGSTGRGCEGSAVGSGGEREVSPSLPQTFSSSRVGHPLPLIFLSLGLHGEGVLRALSYQTHPLSLSKPTPKLSSPSRTPAICLRRGPPVAAPEDRRTRHSASDLLRASKLDSRRAFVPEIFRNAGNAPAGNFQFRWVVFGIIFLLRDPPLPRCCWGAGCPSQAHGWRYRLGERSLPRTPYHFHNLRFYPDQACKWT